MRKIILTLSILGLLFTGLQAQESKDSKEVAKFNQGISKGGNVEQKVKQSIESIAKACGGLSDDQKTKITAINTEKFTKISELRAKMKVADKEAVKKEIEAIRNAYKGNILQVLTPEQLAKLKEYAKANKKLDEKGKKQKKGKKAKKEDNNNDIEKDALDDLDKEDLEK